MLPTCVNLFCVFTCLCSLSCSLISSSLFIIDAMLCFRLAKNSVIDDLRLLAIEPILVEIGIDGFITASCFFLFCILILLDWLPIYVKERKEEKERKRTKGVVGQLSRCPVTQNGNLTVSLQFFFFFNHFTKFCRLRFNVTSNGHRWSVQLEYNAYMIFFAHVKKEKKKRLYNHFAFYANLFLV